MTYLESPDDFTPEQIEEEIVALTRKQIRAEAKAVGFKAAAQKLKTSFIEDALHKAGIHTGDDCMVRFKDSIDRVRLVGVHSGSIVSNKFGKNGRPAKTETWYHYFAATSFQKAQTDIRKAKSNRKTQKGQPKK